MELLLAKKAVKKLSKNEPKVIFFATARGEIIELEKFDTETERNGRYYSCTNSLHDAARYVAFERLGKPHDFRTYGWTPEEAENALREWLIRRAEELETEAAKCRTRAKVEVSRVNF